jgi:hypothetical protein
MRCHLPPASPHWNSVSGQQEESDWNAGQPPCLCVEQVLSCMNDDTTVVAGIRCSINRPLFLSIVAVHLLLGSGSAATAGNDSEDVNVRSGGKPLSHLRQSRLAPSFEVRPCAVTTQGRFVHGGLCRTCWSCPHASSATQSFSLSRWKPTMGCSKICQPRACYFSASSKYAVASGGSGLPEPEQRLLRPACNSLQAITRAQRSDPLNPAPVR